MGSAAVRSGALAEAVGMLAADVEFAVGSAFRRNVRTRAKAGGVAVPCGGVEGHLNAAAALAVL